MKFQLSLFGKCREINFYWNRLRAFKGGNWMTFEGSYWEFGFYSFINLNIYVIKSNPIKQPTANKLALINLININMFIIYLICLTFHIHAHLFQLLYTYLLPSCLYFSILLHFVLHFRIIIFHSMCHMMIQFLRLYDSKRHSRECEFEHETDTF